MKHMKKSMFITTLAMVVVLVVALSTATFAWYSANSKVGASVTSIQSAKSSSASIVVDGAKASSVNASTSSVILTMTQNLSPMVYSGASAAKPTGSTTYGDFRTAFRTFTQDNAGNFASVPASSVPSILSNVQGVSGQSGTSIFITNVGGADIASITAKLEFSTVYYTQDTVTPDVTVVTGKYLKDASGNYTVITTENATAEEGKTYYTQHNDENDNLCVAIFAGNYDAADDALLLKGIYSSKATIQVANREALAGINAEAVANKTSIASTVGNATYGTSDGLLASGGSTGNLNTAAVAKEAVGAIKVKVIAWFEGSGMSNELGGTGANFTIEFTAA